MGKPGDEPFATITSATVSQAAGLGVFNFMAAVLGVNPLHNTSPLVFRSLPSVFACLDARHNARAWSNETHVRRSIPSIANQASASTIHILTLVYISLLPQGVKWLKAKREKNPELFISPEKRKAEARANRKRQEEVRTNATLHPKLLSFHLNAVCSFSVHCSAIRPHASCLDCTVRAHGSGGSGGGFIATTMLRLASHVKPTNSLC